MGKRPHTFTGCCSLCDHTIAVLNGDGILFAGTVFQSGHRRQRQVPVKSAQSDSSLLSIPQRCLFHFICQFGLNTNPWGAFVSWTGQANNCQIVYKSEASAHLGALHRAVWQRGTKENAAALSSPSPTGAACSMGNSVNCRVPLGLPAGPSERPRKPGRPQRSAGAPSEPSAASAALKWHMVTW